MVKLNSKENLIFVLTYSTEIYFGVIGIIITLNFFSGGLRKLMQLCTPFINIDAKMKMMQT